MSRGLRRLLIAVVVLLVVLVVADRVVARVAEGYAEQRLQTALGTPTSPVVDLRGFPVLTQLVRMTADDVRIEAVEVPTDRIVVRRLQADLSDVRLDRSSSTVTAGGVDGTALLAWDDLETASGLGLELSALPDGEVQVERTVEILGVPVRLRGSVEVALVDAGGTSSVALRATSAEVVEPVGFRAPGTLVDLLSTTVPVTGLPAGLALSAITVDDAGVVVDVVGEDVAFAS